MQGVTSHREIVLWLAKYLSRSYIRDPIRRAIIKNDFHTTKSSSKKSQYLLLRFCVCASVNKICGSAFAFLVANKPRMAEAFEVFLWLGGREEMQQPAKLLIIGSNPILASIHSDRRYNQALKPGYAWTDRAIALPFARRWSPTMNESREMLVKAVR